MQLLDRIKSYVGIGAPTITIEGVPRTARAGEVLRGVVVMLGGDHDVPLQDLELHLDEQRLVHTSPAASDAPERQSIRSVVGVTIALDGRVLGSGERLEQAFELRLPAELEPTVGPICYAVIAETEVPGINPSIALPLVITA